MTALALPANLPSIAHAKLPATYEAAKNALAECSRVDECQDWADKMAALASYAKQSEDTELEKLALRIRARAIRRCGELLKLIEPKNGARTDVAPADGAAGRLTRTQAARSAGLSERQQTTAVRVANIPEPEFTAAVDSDAPPTVTALADRGKRPAPTPPAAPVPAVKPAPEGFVQATYAIGTLKQFADFCERHDPALVANGVMKSEVKDIQRQVAVIDRRRHPHRAPPRAAGARRRNPPHRDHAQRPGSGHGSRGDGALPRGSTAAGGTGREGQTEGGREWRSLMVRRWVARFFPRLAQWILDRHVRLSALWLETIEAIRRR